ncbi:MAG: DMT family transporter [Burkholderiaceae bacterium]
MNLRTLVLTAISMLAFAANSLLCRLALANGSIDSASFGSLRLLSGALMLSAILYLRSARRPVSGGADWLAAGMLWAYVVCFSFAYVALSAGTGALILFGAVQLTMFGAGVWSGERLRASAWGGLLLAVGGFLFLVAPGLEAPPPLAAVLMTLAGVAWGVYSLRGRHQVDALAASAGNFRRAAPLALLVSVVLVSQLHMDGRGAAMAIASGAITSGLGYVLWYSALRGLSAMRASMVQLSVPPLAAIGGVWLLSEPLTVRLLLSSAAILGGVALALMARSRVGA